ncbi:MAG: hypothetical protein ACR2MX_06960 [Cyclobacteriaceae bacterium]
MKLLKGMMVLMAGLFFLGFVTISESRQDPSPEKVVIEHQSTPDKANTLPSKPLKEEN